MVSLIFLEVEATDAQDLVTIIYDGYLDGLRDAGWQGDPQLIWLGFATAAVLKYLEMSGALTFPADPGQHETVERVIGRPVDDFTNQLAEMQRLTYSLAEKAWELSSLLD